MNINQMKKFNAKMGKHKAKPKHFAKGGYIEPIVKDGKQYFVNGGAAATGALGGAATGAAVGSIVPGIGTAIGAIGGALIGGLSGLFSGSTNQMPNITDPVTGQQITDANGTVIADQATLAQYNQSLQNANGVGNQSAAISGLQNVANGTGPNPAQAELAQATSQNVANQGALMAGQRGAASNVGLIARQAAQQGAATQQNSAGQAATLQSNQQLNALNSEGAIAGQQVAETQAGLAQNQNAGLTNQNQLLNAQGTYNTNVTGGQGNVNSNNTSLANTTQGTALAIGQGALSGAGAASVANATPASPGSTNAAGSAPSLGVNTTLPTPSFDKGGPVCKGPHKSHVANFLFAKGGDVPAMVSAGERYLNPEEVKQVVEQGENPLKLGTKFEGKAKVKGDSLKNDVISATLREGGVVLPRHITNKKNRDHAELFVRRAVHMRSPKGGK
jgi:hypothetical protein